MRSTNAGEAWQPAHISRHPATMVQATADGTLYAFVVGEGLIKAKEPSLAWATVSNSFGHDVVLHLAVDSTNADRLFAATNVGSLVASTDRGRTWSPFAGK